MAADLRRQRPPSRKLAINLVEPDYTYTGRGRAPSWIDRLSWMLALMAAVYLVAIVMAVVLYKVAFIDVISQDLFFGIYGLVVTAYLLSRFGLSLLYKSKPHAGVQPSVAIIMPAFNEERAIANSLRSLLGLRYPEALLEIVAINDGSSDDTLAELRMVAGEAQGRVHVIDFEENKGKRAAMAAGIRATNAEVVCFVDSDSVLEPNALDELVQPFADGRVGAICGHAEVLNVYESWLTKMQAVRYFVAFKVVKAAESVFGAVTCCSGCFSAYRRDAIMPRLEWWENQQFLGLPSTFGDDRSLTNCVLRDWRVVYQDTAVSHTIVPTKFKGFMRQQARWKRSWTRESLLVMRFMWRKHPIASISVYVGVILPLFAPIVALRAMLWFPLAEGAAFPWVYLVGIYSFALVYSLYYAVRRRSFDSLWVFGIAFVFFYLAFMLWQTYYAILTSRTSAWGTRGGGKLAALGYAIVTFGSANGRRSRYAVRNPHEVAA